MQAEHIGKPNINSNRVLASRFRSNIIERRFYGSKAPLVNNELDGVELGKGYFPKIKGGFEDAKDLEKPIKDMNELLNSGHINLPALFINMIGFGDQSSKQFYLDLKDEISDSLCKEKQNFDTSQYYAPEFRDLLSIARNFVKQGNSVCELFGWSYPLMTSIALSYMNLQGEYHSISALSTGEQIRFFIDLKTLFDHYVWYTNHGLVEKTCCFTEKHTDGWALQFVENKDILERISGILSLNNKREEPLLIPKFKETFGLSFHSSTVPPFPEDIKSGSVDLIIEHEGLPYVYEFREEGVLIESDRALKPGGVICFKDAPDQIATIYYYGQNVFKNYSRLFLSDLDLPSQWLILKKNA